MLAGQKRARETCTEKCYGLTELKVNRETHAKLREPGTETSACRSGERCAGTMAKWFKEHLGFKSAKASPPAPPRPDYRHCHAAAAAAYQHASAGTGVASYPSPAQPDILAAYKLQKELDFEDPYAAGANTPFSGAALSEVKYVSPKHRLIKVETLERSSASPSAGGSGGGGCSSSGGGGGGGSASQAASGSARSPTSPPAEHETKQDKVSAWSTFTWPKQVDRNDQKRGGGVISF